MLKAIRSRLRALFRKNEVERELDDELRYHLEKAIAQNIARGMSAEEARRAALVGFGGNGRPVKDLLNNFVAIGCVCQR